MTNFYFKFKTKIKNIISLIIFLFMNHVSAEGDFNNIELIDKLYELSKNSSISYNEIDFIVKNNISTNIYIGKGSVSGLGNNLYVSLKNDFNEIILPDQNIFRGKSSDEIEIVFCNSSGISKPRSVEEARDFKVILFTKNLIWIIDKKENIAGVIERKLPATRAP